MYVVGGGFSFIDHGQTWTGNAQVEDDRLYGTQHASFYYAGSGDQKLCDAGTPNDPSDDYVGTDYLEFDPTSISIVAFSVRSDLTAGKFSLVMTGVLNRFDGCIGGIISARRERHTFDITMKSTSVLQSETDSVLIDNGDGTTSPGTSTYSYRTATGKASVGSIDATVSDPLIQHVLTTRN